jgi:hypothetical protein
MSLLWRSAALHGRNFGEPSEEYVKQTAHNYLRAHYEDDHPDEPGLHDHFHLRDPQRPERGYTQEVAHSSCPSARECTHGPTMDRIKDITQQNWDHDHERLFYPEDHERHQQQARQEFLERLDSGPLGQYALDHPDRVFPVNQDGSLGEPDDPRLKGY